MALAFATLAGCEAVLDLDWTAESAPSAVGVGGDAAADEASEPEGGPGGGGSSPPAADCWTATDCPIPAEPCAAAACNGGTCGEVPRQAGTDCTGTGGPGVCDGAGSCVDCNADADCTDGDLCTAHVCGHTCHDATRNGHETDIDCGGGACPKCENGLGCSVDSDCKKKHCVDSICKDGG